MHPFLQTAFLSSLAYTLALADPLVTAAAQLVPRATDPGLVGYISTNGVLTDSRTCDYPQTLSTSDSYVQCCPTTGSCPFYTSCSSNTLLAAGDVTVSCDFDATLTCNTAVVVPTAGGSVGGSYLACWQKTLGTGPFTFVQDVGSDSAAVVTPTSTGSVSTADTSSTSRSSSSVLSSRSTNSASTEANSSGAAASTSASSNVAAGDNVGMDISGGFVGAMALMAQMLL